MIIYIYNIYIYITRDFSQHLSVIRLFHILFFFTAGFLFTYVFSFVSYIAIIFTPRQKENRKIDTTSRSEKCDGECKRKRYEDRTNRHMGAVEVALMKAAKLQVELPGGKRKKANIRLFSQRYAHKKCCLEPFSPSILRY